MWIKFLELFEKYFGKQVALALICLVGGWFLNGYVDSTYMTNKAWADHHVKIVDKIDKSSLKNENKLLSYEKRGLIQQKIQLKVEISKAPRDLKVDLKDSLKDVNDSIKDIDDEIEANNEALAK